MIENFLLLVKNMYSKIKENWCHKKFLHIHGLRESDNIFTHLTSAEKRYLFNLVLKRNSIVFVEIGSFIGASASFIAAGLDRTSLLICIDTWENDAMSEGKRNTFLDFQKNTEKYRDIITPIQGYSYEVINSVKEITTEIDFLFIDGDHSYEGCKTDWDLYSPLLKKNGCVIFHDSGWAEGVKKVIEEDVKSITYNHGSLPNMWWGWLK